jgi:RHS repeat-associated protein
MFSRSIHHFVLFFSLLSLVAHATEVRQIPLSMYWLELANTTSVPHQNASTSKVGGFARWVGFVERFSHETLLKAQIPSDLSQVGEVRLRFKVKTSNIPSSAPVFAHAVSQAWSASDVNYSTFRSIDPQTNFLQSYPWSRPLGVVAVSGASNREYVIEGAALASLVESWRTGSPNYGIVLSGAFGAWMYNAEIEWARLEVSEYADGIVNENEAKSNLVLAGGFSFPRGNLIPNWSFEQKNGLWDNQHLIGSEVVDLTDPYFESSVVQPISGRKVLRQKFNAFKNDPFCGVTSAWTEAPIPVTANKAYTLWWHWSGRALTAAPVLQFSTNGDFSQPLSQLRLPGYDIQTTAWKRERYQFTVPSGANFARLILVEASAGTVPSADVLYIDDVILEEGAQSIYPTVKASVTYTDASGRAYQQHSLVQPGGFNSLSSEPCLANKVLWSKSTIGVGARTFVTGGVTAVTSTQWANESRWYGAMSSLVSPSTQIGMQVGLDGAMYTQLNVPTGSESRITTSPQAFVPEQCNPSVTLPKPGYTSITHSSGLRILNPGAYGNLTATSTGSTVIRLSSGEYDFSNIQLGVDVRLEFDLSKGSIKIRSNSLNVGDRVRMSILDGRESGAFVHWSSSQTSNLNLGADAMLIGILEAPNAALTSGPRTMIHGSLIAKQITLAEEVAIWLDQGMIDRGPGLWAVSGIEYDSKGRPVKSGLTCASQHKGFEPSSDPLTKANTWLDGSTSERPDADGYAYSRVTYDENEMGTPALESFGSGAPWANLAQISGVVTVQSLDLPTAEPHTLKDIPVADPMATDLTITEPQLVRYALSYSRSLENQWTLTWTDPDGKTLKTASSKLVGGVWSTSASEWSVTTAQYSTYGKLLKSLSPLDIDNNTEQFAETQSYGSRGELLADWTRERGLTKYWYNQAGQLRYRQSQAQSRQGTGVADYINYDSLGRTIETGVTQYAPDQINADLLASTGPRTIEVMNFYGSFGLTKALHLFPFLSSLGPVRNLSSQGERLALSIHLNPDFAAPGMTSTERRVVATAYSYDSLGRTESQVQYIGVSEQSNRRVWRMDYKYDSLERTVHRKVFACGYGATCAESSTHQFVYDDQGRVTKIVDGSGKSIASYTFGTLGQRDQATAGGAVQTRAKSNIKGWQTERQATTVTGQLLWQQKLGYESQVHPVAGHPTKVDGRITQSLEDYAAYPTQLSQPAVRLNNYQYALDGTLAEQSVQTQMSVARNADRSPSSLNLVDDVTEYEAWEYDANGRAVSRRKGQSGSLNYQYHANSYKLDHIEGATNLGTTPDGEERDFSQPGTLQYDSEGRLVRDASTLVEHRWGASGVVESKIHRVLGSTVVSEHYLYGPDGWRVATVQSDRQLMMEGSPSLVRSIRMDVRLGGATQIDEVQVLNGLGAVDVKTQVALFGLGGRIGRQLPDGTRQWYVRNHQGSVVMMVNDQGLPVNALRYSAYGVQNLMAMDAAFGLPEEQYTGKRMSDVTGLYYFGARFYDPQLGLWLSHDAMREFYNPYGRLGDPVNFVDADGNCELVCITIIVGAAIGAYMGGTAANGGEYDPTEWDYENANTYYGIVGGAAIGAATGWGGGAIAGGVATWAGGGAIGGAIGGAVGGAVAGGVGGLGTYTLNSFTYDGGQGYDWNAGQAWKATYTGAAGGAAGGALGGSGLLPTSYNGAHYVNAFANGFTGGSVSALSGGSSLRGALLAGSVSGVAAAGSYAIAHGAYSLKVSYQAGQARDRVLLAQKNTATNGNEDGMILRKDGSIIEPIFTSRDRTEFPIDFSDGVVSQHTHPDLGDPLTGPDQRDFIKVQSGEWPNHTKTFAGSNFHKMDLANGARMEHMISWRDQSGHWNNTVFIGPPNANIGLANNYSVSNQQLKSYFYDKIYNW